MEGLKYQKPCEMNKYRWKHVALVEDRFSMMKMTHPEASLAPGRAAIECAAVDVLSPQTAEVPDAGIA